MNNLSLRGLIFSLYKELTAGIFLQSEILAIFCCVEAC